MAGQEELFELEDDSQEQGQQVGPTDIYIMQKCSRAFDRLLGNFAPSTGSGAKACSCNPRRHVCPMLEPM
jgi:hypothetical protein